MANVKKITVDYGATGKTVYVIVRREVDNYRLNNADGTFTSAPTNPYLALTEDAIIRGRYEISDSRTVWNDGRYLIAAYLQSGGSPVPASDNIISSGEMDIISDAEIYSDVFPSSRSSQSSVNAIPINPALATDYTAARAAKLDNLDAAVSSRLSTGAYIAPDNNTIALLLAMIKNKKRLQKTGTTWYLIIRNAGDTADILNKALKDSTGADITDIAAGTLAQELASSV